MTPAVSNRRCPPGPDRRRGAALFVVLAMAALLASLVGAAMRTGVSGARAAAVFADEVRADELGRGAGDLVSYRLVTGPADAARGGRLAVHLPDAEIAIDYLSESARIDANTAPIPLISALLTAAGADGSLVEAIGEHLRQTRPNPGSGAPSPPAGSPGSAAASTDAPAAPPGPPTTAAGSATAPPGSTAAPVSPAATRSSGAPDLQSTLQIVRAWGLPDDVGRRVLPALTVASGSKQVDPLLASRLVLLALLDGDETRADDYMTRRAQGFTDAGSALALLPVPSQPFAGFTDVKAVRALARVTIARRFERSYEMILMPGQGANQRPVVVSWRKLL